MKTILTLLTLLTVFTLPASDVIQYDPASPVVANRVTAYRKSVNTTDWTGKPNTLINPTLPAGTASDWKVSGTNVVALSAADLSALATANAQAAALSEAADKSNTVYTVTNSLQTLYSGQSATFNLLLDGGGTATLTFTNGILGESK